MIQTMEMSDQDLETQIKRYQEVITRKVDQVQVNSTESKLDKSIDLLTQKIESGCT